MKKSCLECSCRIAQYTIHTTHNTQQQDACHTNHQAQTHGTSVLESRNRLFVRCDEHGLDNQQVVIQRDDRINQSNEHNQVITAIEGCCKYEELAEEAGKRWNTCQREQGQGHDHGEFRIGLVEAVVIVTSQLAMGVVLYGCDYTEYAEVGHDINHHVVNQRSHALRSACQYGQHDVAGLRDTTECHEALQLALAHGKQVTDGDGRYNDDAEHQAPMFGHRTEYLYQDYHGSKSGCSL